MEPDGHLRSFIDDVGLVVGGTDDEYEITKRVAIYAGAERETRYVKPTAGEAGRPCGGWPPTPRATPALGSSNGGPTGRRGSPKPSRPT